MSVTNNITKLINAVNENDEIYIYVKNVCVDSIEEPVGEEEIVVFKFKVYNSDKSTVINEYDLGTRYLSENEIYELVKDSMITYKHTFKKAEDGSYFWYSTEPM